MKQHQVSITKPDGYLGGYVDNSIYCNNPDESAAAAPPSAPHNTTSYIMDQKQQEQEALMDFDQLWKGPDLAAEALLEDVASFSPECVWSFHTNNAPATQTGLVRTKSVPRVDPIWPCTTKQELYEEILKDENQQLYWTYFDAYRVPLNPDASVPPQNCTPLCSSTPFCSASSPMTLARDSSSLSTKLTTRR